MPRKDPRPKPRGREGRPIYYRMGAEFENGGEAWYIKVLLFLAFLVFSIGVVLVCLIVIACDKLMLAGRFILRVLRGKPGKVV